MKSEPRPSSLQPYRSISVKKCSHLKWSGSQIKLFRKSIRLKMLPRKMSHIIIIIIAFIGLGVQVIYISQRYFLFATRTIINVQNPSHVHVPTLSTCWDIEDVLDIDGINRELNISFPSLKDIKKNLTSIHECCETFGCKGLHQIHATQYFDPG